MAAAPRPVELPPPERMSGIQAASLDDADADSDFEAAVNSAIEALRITLLSEFRRTRDCPPLPENGPEASSQPLRSATDEDGWRGFCSRDLLVGGDGAGPNEESSADEIFPGEALPFDSMEVPQQPPQLPEDDELPRFVCASDDDVLATQASSAEAAPPVGRNSKQRLFQKAYTVSEADEATRAAKRKLVYDECITALIFLNALWLGIEIELRGDSGRLVHAGVGGVSVVFCLLFVADIVWRICSEHMEFFTGRRKGWNLFDFLVVCTMAVDLSISLASGGHEKLRQLTVTRVLRLARLLRVIRAIRTLAAFHDFRIFVRSMLSGTYAFIWMALFCCFVAYVFALGLTEAALPLCTGDGEIPQDLCDLFGSVPQASFTIGLAMFDGLPWGEILDALNPLEGAHRVLFVFQMMFIKIVVVNIVIAMLVVIGQRTSLTEREANIAAEAREEEHSFLELQRLFLTLDLNHSGAISLDEFEIAMDDPRINAFFEHLKIDTSDVMQLFELLDEDHEGAVDIGEFIGGIQRIRGTARETDVIVIMRRCAKILSIIQGMQGQPAQTPVQSRPLTPWPRSSSGSAPGVRSHSNPVTGFLSSAVSSRSRASLAQPEMRALTIPELRQVRALVNELCLQERWTDRYTGEALSPGDVNLYNLVHNYIFPRTATDGVILHSPNCSVTQAGSRVQQLDEDDHCWGQGVLTEMTEAGPRVQLHRGNFLTGVPGRRILVGGVDIGEISGWEAPGAISYKELISSTPTRPLWYCSHWWGESVLDFVSCCEEHARLRRLHPADAAYWICGYANRQHDLEKEIGSDPEQSSFRKAMRLADGLLLHLDEKSAALSRIWCSFELYCTMNDVSKDLDIVSMMRDGGPRLLTDKQLPGESARDQTMREASFPISVLVTGMYARLEDGDASRQSDKDKILRHICACGPSGSDAAEVLQCANAALHSIFARSAWPQAMKRGMVDDFDRENPGALRLPDVLRRDELKRSFRMSLEHLDVVTDDEVAKLAAALPPNLSELVLSFEGCQHVSSRSLEAISSQLRPDMRKLKLDFLGCTSMGNAGLRALAQNLPGQLQELDLHFDRCHGISIEGLRELAERTPRHVTFRGTFRGTQVDRNFASVREMQSFAGQVPREPSGLVRPRQGKAAQGRASRTA